MVSSAFLPASVVGPDGSTGYGDVPRNCFRGPSQKNFDLSIGKVFRPGQGQGHSFKFAVEFFNLMNTISFVNPNPANLDIQNGSFGAISQTVGTPRLIQLVFRYSY